MIDLQDTLEELRRRRSASAENLSYSDYLDEDHVRQLGEIHLAILALEAVMAEPEQAKTGPKVEIGTDGYPL